MTKSEVERLSVVETKIDDMSELIANMEKSLITQINAQEKAISISMLGQKEAIGIAMIASEKAIVKAEIANDLRFSEQDKRINEYVESTNANIKTLTESKDVNAGAKTGSTESKTSLKDVIFYILFAITAVSFIISMYAR